MVSRTERWHALWLVSTVVATALAWCGGWPLSQATAQGDAAATIVPGRVTLGAPVPCTTSEERIDLAAALQLAGVDNPTIQLARERISEALADQLGARVLMLPSLNAGGNFRLHRGALLDDPGIVLNPNIDSLYLGAGAGAVGVGTVAVPGVWLFSNLGNAVFEPRVALHRVSGREADAHATHNRVLLDVATAYLELAGATSRLDLLRLAEADINELSRLTATFAKAGEIAPADANRAAANLHLTRMRTRDAEGEVTRTSARLAQLVNVDPARQLRPAGGAIEPIHLIDEDSDLEPLLATAIRARPELHARAAAILETQTQIRQERARPWLPLIAVGFSGGGFGGGSNLVNDRFAPLQDRTDVTVMAVWTVENLGAGNLARVRRATATAAQAAANHEVTINQVRREVSEAQAAAKVAARQIRAARESVAIADDGFRLETDRIKQGQGRPIEVLDSYRQLVDARLELLRATIAYDTAQFRLFVSLGDAPPSHASK